MTALSGDVARQPEAIQAAFATGLENFLAHTADQGIELSERSCSKHVQEQVLRTD